MAVGERVRSDGDIQEAGQAGVAWRKSSWSAYNGNCVEVGGLADGGVAVRDSKDAGRGPALTFGPQAWAAFVSALKNGDLRIR